jgi:hypothetical protein
MKALILHLTITLIAGYILTSFGLWWGVLPAAILASVIIDLKKIKKHLLIGFFAGFALWLIWSLLLFNDGGDIISNRISQLFELSITQLLIAGSLLGGVLGALGSLIGTVRWKGEKR